MNWIKENKMIVFAVLGVIAFVCKDKIRSLLNF